MLKSHFFNHVILNKDLDLEESKPIFLKDNLAHNDALPYQVGSKRFSDSKKIIWTNIH